MLHARTKTDDDELLARDWRAANDGARWTKLTDTHAVGNTVTFKCAPCRR
jgi:hypothetical protein